MAEMSTVQARDQFSELINRAAFGHERIVLTRRGKALVALVPIVDLELLQQLEDRLDLEEARLALAEAAAGDTVAWEQIKAELGL
ncbi:MAG TPA: type II toxin-antitoxin system Phd/YefM family antitoxin [Chloroflexota bacterium]|nr:type II toxin-antitoxin system Phd/YefM family antitoxin [Chloroflexota bacterium]